MTNPATTLSYFPHSIAEKTSVAAYAILRARDLIPEDDWAIPHEIGAEAQALWDREHPVYPGVQPWGPVTNPVPPFPVYPGVQPWVPMPNPIQPFPPDFPWTQLWPLPTQFGPVVTCTKCGMKWEGAMGYVCPDDHCPVQLKATC